MKIKNLILGTILSSIGLLWFIILLFFINYYKEAVMLSFLIAFFIMLVVIFTVSLIVDIYNIKKGYSKR